MKHAAANLRALLAGLLALAGTAATAQTTPIQENPHDQRFQLARGDKVLLPLHLHEYDQIALFGSVDFNAISAALAREDLQPLPVEGVPGRAQAAVFFVQYRQTDIGAYHESILSIPVVERALPGVAPRVGQLFWDIAVTTDLSRRYGEDVWGLPKRLDRVTLAYAGNDVIGELGPLGRESVQVRCRGCRALPQTPVVRQQFVGVTPYALRRSWYDIVVESPTAGRPFDPAQDVFLVNPRTPMGAKLAATGFQPFQWFFGPGTTGVVRKE